MNDSKHIISTERLRLVSLDEQTMLALIERDRERASSLQGLEITEEVLESLQPNFLALHLNRMRSQPSAWGWFVRLIVHDDDDVVVGNCGFHGPVEIVGRAEIGYFVLPRHRGNSFASEAALGLVAWARQEGSPAVYATVAPSNLASLRVVEKVGFSRSGVQVDVADGEELVFEIRF